MRVGGMAGCTAQNGTPPERIIETIRELEFGATKFETKESRAAWEWIVGSLESERPVVILTQDWGHYEAVVGLLGKRVIVVDSNNTVANKSENGTHVYSRREFMKKWVHSKEGVYFGIAVSRK